MKTIRAVSGSWLCSRSDQRFAPVAPQGKRPADVAKEADVAKDVRRDIGGESNGNWGWIGLLGLAGLAGLLGRYRDGANRSGTNR